MIAVDRDSGRADDVPGGEQDRPAYWLVFGTEWNSDGGFAEAAVAIAPDMVPREALAHDAYQVLGCADLYFRRHSQRVIFFSELTRMFATAGRSWSELGVEWQKALTELTNGRFPAMFMTTSERMYSLITDPSLSRQAGHDLEQVRQVIAMQLMADWPAYVQSLLAADGVRRIG